MANDYGRCYLDRDVSANTLQFAVGQSPQVSGSDHSSFDDYFGDEHFYYGGRKRTRKITIRDAIFRTQGDAENFLKLIQSTTGTMKFEWQVSAGVSASSMFKCDGSNTSLEVGLVDHSGVIKAAPGNDTTFKIRKIIFRQGG